MLPQIDKDKQIQEDEKGSIVDEANKVKDELKAENDRREKLLAQEQKLRAEQILAGTSGAIVQPTPPKVETAKEYADRVMGYKPMGYKKQ